MNFRFTVPHIMHRQCKNVSLKTIIIVDSPLMAFVNVPEVFWKEAICSHFMHTLRSSKNWVKSLGLLLVKECFYLPILYKQSCLWIDQVHLWIISKSENRFKFIYLQKKKGYRYDQHNICVWSVRMDQNL